MTKAVGIAERLWRDTRGGILFVFALTLPIIMAVVALSYDLGRAYTLHTEMQDLADAAAIAAAEQLDGQSNALTRASAAGLAVLNDPKFAEGSYSNVIPIFEFFDTTTPPPKDPSETPPSPTSSDSASFVRVTTNFRSISTRLVTMVGGPSTVKTTAVAVAGSHYVACAVTPMMMCNPLESTGGMISSADVGKQFRLKAQGGTGAYYPGDFGLLDPPNVSTGVGSTLLAQNLANSNPNFCYAYNGVTVAPGTQTDAVRDGIGVRFDIPAQGSGASTMNALPPPPNVIKGRGSSGGSCNFPNTPDTAMQPLPRDNCHPPIGSNPTAASTCSPNATMGDGNFSNAIGNYWLKHYGSSTAPAAAAGLSTRLEIYKAETGCDDETNVCNAANATLSPLSSTGSDSPYERVAPRCLAATGGAIDRRMIYVAVINCSQYGVTGNSSIPLRAAKYAKFFLTEPADQGNIYAELVKVLDPGGDDGKLRHIVQLYR